MAAGTSPISLPHSSRGRFDGHHSGFHFITAHHDLEEIIAGFGRELLCAHVVDYQQIAFEVERHDLLMTDHEIVFEQLRYDVEESLGSDMPVVTFGLSDDLVTFHEVEAFLALRARYPAPEIA